MSNQLPTLASQQRGEGITGIAAMIILFAVTVKMGLAIVPAQLNDRSVTAAIGQELYKANQQKKSERDLRTSIQAQLKINGMYDVNLDEMIQFTNTTPGSLQISKKYIVESNLFPGVFITNKFEGEIEAILPE